ncbi:MAG: energy-coupled thiamine transporter ThiT [Acidaminococcus sp.]|uniref:energy-coupled thiamine transporter ThiT n=1 Tax=Acidaminococcus sp. TaxID=1872103 RepID=UPI003F184FC6
MKFLSMIEKSPLTALTLVGVFLLLYGLLRARKTKLSTHQVTCCALLLALTLILSLLPLYRMPYGGTVTLGGMLPIMFIAFAYGPEVGFLAGFAYGILNLLLNPYILHPVQVLFDYPLPFMALGLCGFFPKHPYGGMVVAVAVRYLCHFISGVAFFASYAPAGMSPVVYSLVANGTYLIPDLIICLVLYRVLPMERFKGLMK